MKIEIRNLQREVRINKKRILACARRALKIMEEDDAELSLMFVDEDFIRRLNRKFRGVDSKTDVLAFPMREGEGVEEDSPLLGDVVISIETAHRVAKKTNTPLTREIDLYLIHGILHLLGYNDVNLRAREKMKMKEEELFRLCSGKLSSKVLIQQ